MSDKPSDPASPSPPQPPPELAPTTLDHQLQQALAHHRAGELIQAETLYRQILETDPSHIDALYLLSTLACNSGQFATALELTARAILARPDLAELHAKRGNALAGLAQHQAALASFDTAIRLKPAFVEARCDRGNALYALQRYQEAADSFSQAIQLNPNFAGAHSNRGIALNALGQYRAAIVSFDAAIHLSPTYAEAHHNRGIAFYALHQYQEALDSLDQAILHQPGYAEAHAARGSALQELRQFPAALESFDRALQLNPNDAETHSNRANALHQLRQYQAAIESCDRALQINPAHASAWNNRGNSLYALQRYREAQQDFNQCIRLQPAFAEAHNNLGAILQELHQYQAALDAIDRAIQLQPDFAQAHNNRGNVLQHLEQYPAALESFTAAMRLDRGCDYAGGMRLHMKRFLCDWENFDAERLQVEARIARNQKAAIPFVTIALISSPALQKQAVEMYMRDRYPATPDAAPIPHRPQRGKIRIGYFSADFRRHAVSYLAADLFEHHDKSRFEILGFAFGPDVQDEVTHRVAAAMDRFIDIRSLSDRQVVELSRKLELDIAVDLTGLTAHHRAGIFAARAAPIQVNYLGYPGTMGAGYIDYLIADEILIPASTRHHYTERIAYLPDSYQANDSRRSISATPCTRTGEGLPETGFVFCCFNTPNKILPSVFELWMRILTQVPHSVLWLLEDNPWVAAKLRKHAAHRGIAPERLIFARPRPLPEHLARLKLAGLVLDTFPYNAHTTASDALWAGVPVLTRMGETFASRVAASLLRAVSLPELITTTEQAYQSLAIDLALHPERLHQLRESLTRNRLTTPLFDSATFARHIEAAYTAMLYRYHSHLPPDHIHIPR